MGLINRFNIYSHLNVNTILGQNSSYIGAGVTAADQTVYGTLNDQQKSQCLRMQGDGSAYFYAADNTNAIEFAAGVSTNGNGFIGTISAEPFEIRTSNVQRMLFGATGGATITNGDASQVALTIKRAANQNTDIFKIVDENNSVKMWVDQYGSNLRLAGLNAASGSNNATLTLPSMGTIISRNVADANPALLVNQANAASTGKILDLQFNGSTKGYISIYGNFGALTIDALAGSPYGQYILGSSNTSPSILRNTNDNYSVINFNNKHASSTGDLSTWQNQSIDKARIDNGGVFWAQGYKSQDGTAGASGTMTLASITSVTVKNGLITAWS